MNELELNIKAIEAMGFKVKNNLMSPDQDIYHKDGDKTFYQLKDLDTKQGIVSFYFSAFNFKDSVKDIVLPGAFTKTIKENRDRIKHLYNHNTTQSPGVIKELGQDTFGAFAVSQLFKAPHVIGQNVMVEYESGGITEHSMGYRSIKERFDSKQDANLISEVYLWEVSSLTAWGANKNARTIEVKDNKGKRDYVAEKELMTIFKGLQF